MPRRRHVDYRAGDEDAHGTEHDRKPELCDHMKGAFEERSNLEAGAPSARLRHRGGVIRE